MITITFGRVLCLALLLAASFPVTPVVGSDEAKDIEQLQKKAVHGNVEAQFNLGLMYHGGEGVPQDYKEAVKWGSEHQTE